MVCCKGRYGASSLNRRSEALLVVPWFTCAVNCSAVVRLYAWTHLIKPSVTCIICGLWSTTFAMSLIFDKAILPCTACFYHGDTRTIYKLVISEMLSPFARKPMITPLDHAQWSCLSNRRLSVIEIGKSFCIYLSKIIINYTCEYSRRN